MKKPDKPAVLGWLPFWVTNGAMSVMLTHWVIDDPSPLRILAAVAVYILGFFVLAVGGITLSDYFRRTTDYRGTLVGGAIGFWVGAFILAKLPAVQASGIFEYATRISNVVQGLALIGLCLIFGIVIGALFDKAPSSIQDDCEEGDCDA